MADSKTVKVRLLAPRFIKAGSKVGDEFDVGEALAKRLKEQGRVEIVGEKSDTPDDSWKNADIKAYAEERGVDLGGATTKKDMLQVLADVEAARTAGQQNLGAGDGGDSGQSSGQPTSGDGTDAGAGASSDPDGHQ